MYFSEALDLCISLLFLSENAKEYLQTWYQWICNAQSEIANYIVVGTASKPRLFPPIASTESMK